MKLSEVKLSSNKSFDSMFFTPEEYKMQWGENLSTLIIEEDDNSNKVDRFINNVGLRIREIVRNYSFKELCLYKDELYYNGYKIENEAVIRAVKLAAMEQCSYMLVNGDLGLRSGIGASKQIFRNRDKKKVMYSPHAIELLMQAGLLGGVL